MKLITLLLTCLFCFSLAPVWAAMEINVANVQELVAQIGSHRTLKLAPGTYNLGEVTQIKGQNSKRIHNGGLMIYDVNDLKLVGNGAGRTKILSPFAESDVLSFNGCSDIQVKSLSIGHRIVPQGCQGDAVYIRDCQNLEFTETDIYGCGQYSLTLRFVDNIQVKDSNLHDCSYGLIDAYMVRNGKFVDTKFVHTGKQSAINTNGSTEMTFENCRFFIDPNRKPFSYEGTPLKEYVAKYSLCSEPQKEQVPGTRSLTFKNCQFSHVDPVEIKLLKNEGVTF